MHHQLTLSHRALHLPAAFTRHSLEGAAASASPPSQQCRNDTAQFHPTWIQQQQWTIDEPILLARLVQPIDSASSSPSDLTFDCTLCRIAACDPTLARNWDSCDVSCTSTPTVSFRASIARDAWSRIESTEFKERKEEECEAEDAKQKARERAAKEAAAAAALTAASSLKTPPKPSKSKQPLMQLPSARSLAAAEATQIRNPTLSSTLAAAIRVGMRIHPIQMPIPVRRNADVSLAASMPTDLYALSLRSFKSNSANSSSVTAATRVVLTLTSSSAASASTLRCTKEEEMELAGMLKRFLHRGYLCSSAVIDVSNMISPKLQAMKYLRVKEISPEGEVCQITRATHFIVETFSPSATSSSSTSVININHSAAAASGAPSIHPALAALHALLLPPLLYPQAFEHLQIDTPKGLLLSGPPGVGKTYSVSSVCRSLGVELFLLDSGTIYTHQIAGAAEAAMRDMFAQARRCEKPSVLFIDEIDVLCPHRTNESSQLSNRLVAQLLSLMDGLENRGHLLIVGATNHPNSLDAALRRPGRFDRELRLDPPSPAQRLDLLRSYTTSMPLSSDVDLTVLSQRTIGYVAADLAALSREAAMKAMERWRTEMKLRSLVSDASQPKPSVSQADFFHALLLVPASSLRGSGVLSSKPTSSFNDIGGLTAVKRVLQQAVEWPLLHAQTFRTLGLTPPRGILLYGPPGCAKTSLVRAIAASTSAAFLPLDTATLYSCYVGEAERILRNLFIRARANRPCVVFLDELDAMVSKRDMGSGGGGDANSLETRILATLLNEMDGMTSPAQSAGLLVVAATNRVDRIDEALLRPGRFDQIVYVPPPDPESRLAILQLHTRAMLHEPDTEETIAELTQLANSLERYTGADITNLCREAALAVLRGDLNQQKVTVSDLRRVASTTSPSLTEEMIRHYSNARVRD